MNDRDFLAWLHDRLEHVHGEDPLVDYMGKLRAIIRVTSNATDTTGGGGNSLYDVLGPELSADELLQLIGEATTGNFHPCARAEHLVKFGRMSHEWKEILRKVLKR